MKTIEIKNNESGISIDVKRFYFNGSYEVECPTCKSKMKDDFSDNYLSYPTIGKDTTRYFCCENCNSEYELNIKIKSFSIEFEIDESKLDKQ